MDRHKIETPEKSGIQAEQIHHQDKAALLCNASRIAAPVNNSLCCTAAGITALCCSTAEALIPHEKLREAATPDAMLIAQICPLAQLAQGYEHLSLALQDPTHPPEQMPLFEKKDKKYLISRPSHINNLPRKPLHHKFDDSRVIQSLRPTIIVFMNWSDRHFFSPAINIDCERKPNCSDGPQIYYQDHIHFRNISKRKVVDKFIVDPPKLKIIDFNKVWIASSRVLQYLKHTITLNRQPNCYPSQIFIGSCPLTLIFIQLMSQWNKPRSQDRDYRANSLNPCRSILTIPRPSKNPPNNYNRQRRKRQHLQQDFNWDSNVNFLGQHSCLLGANQHKRLPSPFKKIQGETR